MRTLLDRELRQPTPSVFTTPRGAALPEFDRFALFAWDEASSRVGRSPAHVLAKPEGTCIGSSPATRPWSH